MRAMKPALFMLLPLFLVSIASQASEALEQINLKYQDVLPAQSTQSPGKVEVVELFWYGCPHCYHFEPKVKSWLKNKPDYVVFKRIPAIFRESWMPHAKFFYAAEQMGKLDELHDVLFAALHEKRQKVYNRKQLADLVARHGIDRKTFLQNYDSFSVASKARQAAQLTRKYGIQGVPSMIVNGKYRTSGNLAGSLAEVIKVVNVLVDEEHKAIAKVVSTNHESGAAK